MSLARSATYLIGFLGTPGMDPKVAASSPSAVTDPEASAAAFSETQPIDLGALTSGVRLWTRRRYEIAER